MMKGLIKGFLLALMALYVCDTADTPVYERKVKTSRDKRRNMVYQENALMKNVFFERVPHAWSRAKSLIPLNSLSTAVIHSFLAILPDPHDFSSSCARGGVLPKWLLQISVGAVFSCPRVFYCPHVLFFFLFLMIVASPIYLQSWPMLSQPAYVEMPQAYRQ
jgi:hypothetical protein